MPVVTVYTRRGCHLCEEAERIVAAEARGRAEVVLVDIDADETLTDRYTVRVPVVAVDGVEVAELVVGREEVAEAIGAATSRCFGHPRRR